jgi:type IV fimbrial biogenesis protein FimT
MTRSPMLSVVRGFTMIELMVVVALGAIFLALAAPSFQQTLQRQRLIGQANEFATDLQYARSEAVQLNRNVFLETGGAGTCYTVATWVSGTGSCDCAASTCTGGPRALKFVALNSAVTITNGVRFDFEPVRGALQGGADVSASVTNGAMNLQVDVPSHGRAALCAPSGSSVKGYPSC